MLKFNNPKIRDRLLRVALRLLGNRDEAEDIAQEVLLKLCQKDGVENLNNVEAYAVTMAKNLCLDAKRKVSRARMVDLEYAVHKSGESTPDHALEVKEHYHLVSRTIDGLIDSYKMVIHLRDIEEMELKEIASIMQMSENQVRVTLSRARKKVRDAIEVANNEEYEKSRRAAR